MILLLKNCSRIKFQYQYQSYNICQQSMTKHKKKPTKQPQQQAEQQEEQVLSQQSSEDDDAALLTSKVQEKLLFTLAKIKLKDPSIYQKSNKALFQDNDFEDQAQEHQLLSKKTQKFTYKKLLQEGAEDSQQQGSDLPIVVEERKAKQSFKNALKKNIKKIDQQEEDLFNIVKKIGKKQEPQAITQKQKFKQLTNKFNKDSKKLIKKVWKSEDLDETDLFLKNYILDKKWLSSKHKVKQDEQQQIVDQQDEQRSLEMDQYQAEYNFRFEEPGGTAITQYPRQMKSSLRLKPQTRKQKQKKKEQIEMRKEAELNKEKIKKNILQKMVPQDEIDHDWFFCDDCCKGLTENQAIWKCNQCQDYMLCSECFQIIIHKHSLQKTKVPLGFGAPQKCENVLEGLKSCLTCRRRIPTSKHRYQYTDRSYIVNSMCQECYDQSKLQIKKKYKRVEAQQPNIVDLLQQNPEKIKQLTDQKEIEEMVDEYIRNDFEGVLSGGLRTKFRYINVPAQGYGLSDEQILYGDDKELNKYISVKKLAPYNQQKLRLKNNLFNKKIRSIKKSVKNNKQLLKKGIAQLNRVRLMTKLKSRANAIRQRTEKRLRIVNLSNKQKQRDYFVSSNRLKSYGIKDEKQDQK